MIGMLALVLPLAATAFGIVWFLLKASALSLVDATHASVVTPLTHAPDIAALAKVWRDRQARRRADGSAARADAIRSAS
jgi:hypothetical protein